MVSTLLPPVSVVLGRVVGWWAGGICWIVEGTGALL
jgi:hypothetical protein